MARDRRSSRVLARISASVLDDVAAVLHRVQLQQLVPARGRRRRCRIDVAALAARLGAEDVQLWYQMAVNGRRDLPLAPTPRAGFEMALLRMLAFRARRCRRSRGGARARRRLCASRPRTAADAPPAPRPPPRRRRCRCRCPPRHAARPAAPRPSVAAARPQAAIQPSALSPQPSPDVQSAPSPQPSAGSAPEHWSALIEPRSCSGPVGQLALHASLIGDRETVVRLALKPVHEHLARGLDASRSWSSASAPRSAAAIKVKFERDKGGAESPAEQRARTDTTRQQQARTPCAATRCVQSLMRDIRRAASSRRSSVRRAPIH